MLDNVKFIVVRRPLKITYPDGGSNVITAIVSSITDRKQPDEFDIYEPESGKIIASMKIELSKFYNSFFFIFSSNRTGFFSEYKVIENNKSTPSLVIRKTSIISMKYTVSGPNGSVIGYFENDVLKNINGFTVYDSENNFIGNAKWEGGEFWKFKLTDSSGREIGNVSSENKPDGNKEPPVKFVITFDSSLQKRPTLKKMMFCASLALREAPVISKGDIASGALDSILGD